MKECKEVAMTDTMTRGAGPAARAPHAGDDGPAPAGGEWRGRRRIVVSARGRVSGAQPSRPRSRRCTSFCRPPQGHVDRLRLGLGAEVAAIVGIEPALGCTPD